MTISDANPVQFWPTGEDTYNETSNCSVEPVFFCQPFECTDEITTQISDSPLSRELVTNTDFDGNINGWDGDYPLAASSALETWSYDAGSGGAKVVATINYVLTRGLKQDILKKSNNDQYSYHLKGSITCSSYPSNIVLLIQQFTAGGSFLSETQVLSQGSNGNFDVSGTFTRPNLGFIAIQFDQAGGASAIASGSFIVTEAHITGTVYRSLVMDIYDDQDVLINSEAFSQIGIGVFQESFIPESFDITCQEITLKIRDSFDDSILAKSDCIDIRTYHECAELIQFSNTGPFVDLEFDPVSPSTDFYLRVPATFNDNTDEWPDEHESIDLSDSDSVQLVMEVKHKRVLAMGFLPAYMITKSQLVLSHDNVTIQGKRWGKWDGMEKVPGNKHYPLRKVNFLLTDKDFIKRNVL